jgi:type VI protein secretion system component Hcp
MADDIYQKMFGGSGSMDPDMVKTMELMLDSNNFAMLGIHNIFDASLFKSMSLEGLSILKFIDFSSGLKGMDITQIKLLGAGLFELGKGKGGQGRQ